MSTTTKEASMPDLEMTKSILKGLVEDVTAAINSRQFSSPADPALQHMSSQFRGQPADYPEMNLEEYIKHLQSVNKAFPDWQLKSVEVMMEVDDTIRPPVAHVFLNNEIHGIPPGHIRPYAGVSTFKFQEGKWMCVALKEFTGFGE